MFPIERAIHVTWTTYGSWLPGDERGHTSNTLNPAGGFEPKSNVPTTESGAPDPYTRERARAAQLHPTVYLTALEAEWLARELEALARATGWSVVRAAVMGNHAHVLVADCPDDGPAVRRKLKGVTQAALSKRLGRARKWWTDDGSNRYKRDAEAVEAAINYIAQQEGMLAGVEANRAFAVRGGEIVFLEDE